MVDVFTFAVNTLLVHLIPCTFSCIALGLFATLNLLLIFFFVGSCFVHIGHEISNLYVVDINSLRSLLGERKAHLAYPR